MKNLKNIATILTFVLSIFMISNSNAQKGEYTESYVKGELRQGMASFVDGLRSSYEKGMDYNDFLAVLIGENSTYDMPKEGNSLLEKSFIYLEKGYSYEQLSESSSVEEIAAAALYIHKYNSKYKSSNGDSVLFGLRFQNEKLNSQNKLMLEFTDASFRCRWWQVGCHLRSIFGESGGNAINNAIVEIILNFLKGL